MAQHLERLGLSLPAFLLFSIASVLSVPLAFLERSVPLLTMTLLGISITVVAGVTAWLLYLASRGLRLGGPLRLAVFAVQLIIIGLVRGVAFYYFVEIAGAEQPAPLGFRVLNSIIVTLIWLWLACAVVTGRREYLRTYRTLVNQAVFSTAARDDSNARTGPIEIADLDSAANIVALKGDLSEIRRVVAQSGLTEESLVRAATAVREVIEKTLRPMSHRLWFNATEGTPQVRARGLISDAVSNLRYATWRVLGICSVLMLFGGLAFLPLGTNLLTVAISTVVLGTLLAAHTVTLRRWSGPHLLFNTVYLCATGILTYLVTYWGLSIFSPSATETFSALVWIMPFAVWIVVWADSALRLIARDRRVITSALRDNASGSEQVEQELLASYLHNSLQSELTGIAYQLESSARTLDSRQSRQSLERLGALISRSISQDFANFTETPLARISRIVDAWAGIAEVTISISPEISEEDARLTLVVQIIEEGITNAVRHAGATIVHAAVTPVGENLSLELTSNQPVRAGASAGLGSAWLERYSLDNKIQSTQTGTTMLTVEL